MKSKFSAPFLKDMIPIFDAASTEANSSYLPKHAITDKNK